MRERGVAARALVLRRERVVEDADEEVLRVVVRLRARVPALRQDVLERERVQVYSTSPKGKLNISEPGNENK